MGTDYQARKSAKKNRKRESELKPRRERKKKQARRLCRGPCYQEPGLTAEDIEEAGAAGAPTRAAALPAGELARFAEMSFGGAAPAAAPAAAADKKQQLKAKRATQAEAKGKAQQQQQQQEKGKAAAAPQADADADAKSDSDVDDAAAVAPARAPAAKRLKLSTTINLLDARTAKTEAPRQKDLPPGSVSEELQQFPELIQRFMAGEGFAEPMAIQIKCWPLLLAGRDVQALAEPGSGKTLAYLLPAAEMLVKKGHGAATQPDGPLALVMLPTRELAQQVATICRDLRKHSGLRTACITGGTDRQSQLDALGKQPHIVVATPGRLLDLVQDGSLQLGCVRYCVLDEADKMLGLGFQPQIDALKALLLPPASAEAEEAAEEEGGEGGRKKARRVQVGLFTATMPEALQSLADSWLHRPIHIRISTDAASISRSVGQVVQVCAEHKKPAKLAKHLQNIQKASKGQRNPPRVLIFANRIKTVRFLHGQVSEAGYRVALLHGERSQEEREAAMSDFRSGKARVLVATDVAARGLHIRNLPYVVNYDFPPNLESYIHRVGRTGRLATDGHAFSFFTREMARLAPPLVQLLEQHGQSLDPNLVKLKEAFEIAAEKLGLLADATGEAPTQPQKEDVLRGLGMKTQQQKKKERQQERRQAGKKGAPAAASSQDEASEEEDNSGSEEEAEEGARRGGQGPPASQGPRQQQAAGSSRAADDDVPADEREAPPFFVSSKAFRGARPGYAFKKGRQGVGYYLDAWSQQRLQTTAEEQQTQQADGGSSGSGKKKRKQGQEDPAKAAQKQQFQELKQKYTHAPIGGRGGDSSRPAASAKARREQKAAAEQQAQQPVQQSKPMQQRQRQRDQQQAQQQAQQAKPTQQQAKPSQQQQPKAAATVAPLLPGRLQELKRQRELAAVQGKLPEYSSNEDEPAPAAAAAASKRYKAMPGRLRKKLAKERAARD